MPSPQVIQLVSDPSFNRQPWDERKKRIAQIDPSFAKLSAQDQDAGLRMVTEKHGAKENVLQSAEHDITLGFRGGFGHLANTAANAAHLIGEKKYEKSLRGFAVKETPKSEEYEGRTGIVNQVLQGAGSAIPGAVEYAPAMLAKKYSPLVAGVIGTVGALDKGTYEALGEGLKQGVGFGLMNAAANLPTRGMRIAGSAIAQAAPSFISDADKKSVVASAIAGGVLGGIASKPQKLADFEFAKNKAIQSFTKDLYGYLAPAKLDKAAQDTARIIIPQAAERAIRVDRAEFALREARKAFDKLPNDPNNPGGVPQQSLDFIHNIETGNIDKIDPALQPFAKEIRRAFDDRLVEIQKHGRLNEKNGMKGYVEDYFPHLFTKPERAEQAVASLMGKRKLEGGKGFLKRREYATVRDVIDFAKENNIDLQLVSNNPIDIALLAMREQDKFITGRNIVSDMEKAGLAKKIGQDERVPLGYHRLTREHHNYIAPDGAARVIDNYLSPGLRDKAWFSGVMNLANSLNMFQLGFSAFHLGFTTTEAATSQLALAIEKGIHGLRTQNVEYLKQAGKDAALATVVGFEPWVKPLTKTRTVSNMLMEEWQKPGSHPQLAPMVENMKQAGARLQLDPEFKTDLMRHAKSSWKTAMMPGIAMSSRMKAFGGAGARILPAITEKVMSPLFDYAVPMQKVGAFHRLAEFELARLKERVPEPSQAQVREVLQKSWSSIDNRFGQLVYDNLFWRKTTKDLMMSAVRSVGWNWGTFAEIGGGGIDSAKAIKNILKKDPWEFTHKMAYITALPMVVGTLGAIMTYLNTGKGPQEMVDYFYPKTGGTDDQGRPERTAIPSYIRDIYGLTKREGEDWTQYRKRAAQIGFGKMHPLVTNILEMFQNEDWRKEQIYHPDDPFVKQMVDSVQFMTGTVIPMSLRYTVLDKLQTKSVLGGHSSKYTTGQSIGSFFGFTPAPASLKERAYEVAESRFAKSYKDRTSEAVAKADRKEELARALRVAQRTHDDKEFNRLASEGKKRGEITDKDIEQVKKTYSIPSGVSHFKELNLEQALGVYFNYVNTDKTISKDEKQALRIVLGNKIRTRWGEVEALPEGDKKKTKMRNMLRLLNIDEQGEDQ